MNNETKRAAAELEALGAREQSTGVYLMASCRTSKAREAARTVARIYGWTERSLATPNGSAWLFSAVSS